MKSKFPLLLLPVAFLFSFCHVSEKSSTAMLNVRGLADTIGFAHLDWQMDSVVTRINRDFSEELESVKQPEGVAWKTAICPHDDYTYTSWLYPAVLKNIKAKTVILFGVAHKAKNFHLENQIVFDSYSAWHGPYGNVKVSPLREEIMKNLPQDLYVINDSMQQVEHSVESMIPFLQNQRRDVEIVSILVPYVSLGKMDTISDYLASAIQKATENLTWGNDFALLITTDAVHYGDEEWGGSNYAPFGTDSAGYNMTVDKELTIVNDCFTGPLSIENANRFYAYTVKPDNFREYQWTWCGRYSVPMGLKTASKLQQISGEEQLAGIPLGYMNSINHPELKVDDLRMGKTAIANLHHWVGYAAVGFR